MNSTNETYKEFVRYYDLYVGNFIADLDFYKSLCKKNDRILEVGCGTGRVMLKFLYDGFQITGIDISNEMLDVAKKKLKTFEKNKLFRLAIHNLSEKPLTNKFDKVLVTFYTFNYIIKNPEIFLCNLYETLNNKGIVVFDLFYPKTLSYPQIEDIWSENTMLFQERNVVLKDKRKFKDNLEYRTQIYTENGISFDIDTKRRYFSPDDMKLLLENAGFKNIRFSTRYDSNTFSDNIDEKALKTNYIVIAEKQE